MPWTPKFAARFELPICRNVKTIVTRGDMRAALDYFNPIEAALDPSNPNYLKDFAEVSLGTEKGLEFPILVIGPRSNPVETVADAARLEQAQTIELKVGVIADSSDAAMERIMIYVQALDAVLRSAHKNDYCANMTNGNNVPFGFSIDVTHEYGPLGANDNRTTYFKPASLTLTVNFNER